VLAWKGAITARQFLARLARSAADNKADPETARLFQDLNSVSQQLARLTRATADPKTAPDLPRKIQALNDRRERLEAELSRRPADSRRLRDSRKLQPADLQKLLAPGTALVDFLVVGSGAKATLTAFVVDARQIERIELGELDSLAPAIDAFRASLKRNQPLLG